MKKIWENALIRINAVLKVLSDFSPAWSGSVAFTESVTQLKSKKTMIDVERKRIETDSQGVTNLKDSRINDLILVCYTVSSGLAALSKKTKDQVLLNKVKFTKSELKAMRANLLISTATTLLEEAKRHATILVDYQIVEADITEMEGLITECDSLVIMPQMSINDGKVARIDLDDLFKEVNVILTDELDLMMVPFERKNPDFYRAYMIARKSVKYGMRHNNDDDETETDQDTPNE